MSVFLFVVSYQVHDVTGQIEKKNSTPTLFGVSNDALSPLSLPTCVNLLIVSAVLFY